MSNSKQKPTPPRILNAVVALLVGGTAIGLALGPLTRKPESPGQPGLSALNQRATMLRKVSDPIDRDRLCIPLSAYGRMLDRALPKTARVFMSGMLGETNGPKLGYYYFLRNYLFPRDVEISLDRMASFNGQWFDGTPCDSPEELRTNGFDILLRDSGSGAFQLIPLTTNGIPK